MELKLGSIIEFVDKGRHRLAVVLRDEGKQKRFRILTEDAREASIGSKQITLPFATYLNPDQERAAVTQALAKLRAEAVEAGEGNDADFLWELVTEEHGAGKMIELDVYCELIFGTPTPLNLYAATLLLREADLHFKSRNKGFEPRTAKQIDQLQQARSAIAERDASMQLFIDRSVEIMAAPEVERRALTESACENESYARRFELMRNYALAGDDFRDAEEMDELIDRVEALVSYRFDGRQSLRGFDLLVQLGYWHRDENLLLLQHRIPTSFREDVLEQTQTLSDATPDLSGREDLTSRLTFSIDDAETKDIDDALSIEARPGGCWELGIHIAAPTLFVPLHSPLEEAARRRGSTLYLPNGRIPMFPPALSEDLFSLVQRQRRAALSFLVDIDETMEVSGARIVASYIEVDERLTYEGASQLIEYGETPVAEALRNVHMVTEMLAVGRQNAGSTHIQIPDVKIRVSAEGEIKVERLPEHSFTNEIVAETMVLANSIAAEFCRKHGIPTLYRTQEPPDPPLSEVNLHEIPEGLPRAFATMRSMRPASNSMEARPHAGLGVDAYVQVTSPIRRYGDFLTHLQIHAHLANGEPALSVAEFSEIITVADANAGDARAVSRETTRYWMLRHLEEGGRTPLTATIIDYPDEHNDKANVVLNQTMLRTYVSTRQRLPLGSEIQVRVARCYPRAGYFQVQLIEETSD